MDKKIEFILIASLTAVGLALGFLFHRFLMPLMNGLGYCLLTGALFGLVNYSIVHVLYKRNCDLRKDLGKDRLTGLFNRSAFDHDIASLDANQQYSVLFIDIDDFKQFNDKFGHQTGDYVLEKVSQSIRSLVRFGDKVYRYGGEEITVFLPDCSKLDAVKIGGKLRREIAELNNTPYPKITISVGVATFPEDGSAPEAIVAASDRAMLTAKKQGKNRVKVA